MGKTRVQKEVGCYIKYHNTYYLMKKLTFILSILSAATGTAQSQSDTLKNDVAQHDRKSIQQKYNADNEPLESSAVYVETDKLNTFSAQLRLWEMYGEMIGGYTSDDVVPFWMRANKFGSVPLYGASGSAVVSIKKRYDPARNSKPDWGMGMEGRLNMGYTTEFVAVEAYLKGKWGPVQLKLGRSKDLVGLADSTLGMGSFAMSGNALGVPKIELSMPEFWYVPFLWKLFSVKGNFSIGWLGETPIAPASISGGGDNRRYGVTSVNTLLHQKSLYIGFGKPEWRLHLYGGFNHQTEFGNEDEIYKEFNLTNSQAIYYAIMGKTWFAKNGFSTKLGNQLGSIDVSGKYKFNKFTLYGYHQFFYDVGALAHLANLKDGLTGISITNNLSYKSGIHLKKLVVEYFYSKSQAGELDSPPTPSGDEDYYNNYLYVSGWSYKNAGIGNPFITPRIEARAGQVSKASQYFINNRVIAYHVASEIQAGRFNVVTKLSYSKNFGTFATSPEGMSTGNRRVIMAPPYFQPVNQFSGYIGCSSYISKKWIAELALASDYGDLLNNSTGISLAIKRFF
jgi:hypothetical protein